MEGGLFTEANLFAKALGIESPWFFEEFRFDAEGGRLEENRYLPRKSE
jgi:hypothetical protein